jgi:hypothetical protein
MSRFIGVNRRSSAARFWDLGLFGKIPCARPKPLMMSGKKLVTPFVINKTHHSDERPAACPCNNSKTGIALVFNRTCFSLSVLYFYPADSARERA